MEDMRIKLTDGRNMEDDARPAEPLVMVPLYWLENIIRESELYRHDEEVEELRRALDALQGQVDVQHDALVELKRLIEGAPEETEPDPGKASEKYEPDKMSEKEEKASENPEKMTSEPEKCTETTRKRSRSPKRDPEEAGKKKIDDGKIRALYEGGWSVKNIAGEMHLTYQTIYNHLKAMGLMS